MESATVCIFCNVSPGQALRLTRVKAGLSQLELAAFAGCQITDVRRAEHDRRISPDKLDRIRIALKLDDSPQEHGSQEAGNGR
jgi:transcriptional regulator with XRE-family HTH domain